MGEEGLAGADRAPARRAGTEPGPGLLNTAGFWVFWALCVGLERLVLRLRVENPPRLAGAYVLAGNHTSYIDPLVVGACVRRRVRFLMTSLAYDNPRWQWYYRWMRALPVAARGGNRDTLRRARGALAAGEVLGIFPEGGMSRDGGLLLGQPGAVALGLGTGVPVVPFGVIGARDVLPPTRSWPRPRRVTVRFGRPLTPDELMAGAPDGRKERLAHATARIMREIAALTEQRTREAELAAAGHAQAAPI